MLFYTCCIAAATGSERELTLSEELFYAAKERDAEAVRELLKKATSQVVNWQNKVC